MGKIQVSRNSWHYKVQDFVGIDVSQRTNLCSYLRGLSTSLTALTCFAISPFTPLIWYLIDSSSDTWIVGFAIGSVAYLFYGVMFVRFIVDSDHYTKWKDQRDERRRLEQPKIVKFKQPSLWKEWLKAKKQKICPQVEFK